MCGKTKLHEKIASENKETIDWEKSVTWHQWKTEKSEKNKKKKFDKVLYMGQLSSLLALFCSSVDKLSTHLFHFQWQAMQFEECKKQLQKGDRYHVPEFPHSSATFNINSGLRVLASPKVLQRACSNSACPTQCSQPCPMLANRHLTGLTWFPIVLYYIK